MHAGVHEGSYAQRLGEQGGYARLVAENEAVRARNIEIMCARPESLIHEVSQKRTIFTRADLEAEIIRRMGRDAFKETDQNENKCAISGERVVVLSFS